jgi:EAL domain-containing protein (putative c-di-GMP-specific phosphodiesterase class I)
MVKAHGCAYAQGHYFSGPLTGDDVLHILQSRTRFDIDADDDLG